MNSEVSILMWKELRQLPRKRAAMITAIAFPLLFFVVMPVVNMVAVRSGPTSGVPVGVGLPLGLAGMAGDPDVMFRNFTLPLFVTVAGLMLPSVMATYTIVVERERRTLELLVALPVSVTSIVLAKLATVLMVGAGIALPLLVIDSAALIALGFGTFVDALVLFWLLVASLAYSTASALLITLLARDYRTANNLSGAVFGPLIIVSMGALVLLPAGVGPLALGVLLLVLAAVLVVVALRWLTFERLLS